MRIEYEVSNQLAKNQQPPSRYRATRDDVRSADARVYESGGVGENLGGEESNVLFPYEESPVDKGGNLGTFFECRGYELGLRQ